ncbi:MAG: hypothetical protein KAG61_10705 [Bacteriovoracaceae bacterium]|nr:hypothetical protein [Bacteriovoracaceae bacterium]
MELVIIKGKLYWFTDVGGKNVDGIALGALGDSVAMKKEDVYYIFENCKADLWSWMNKGERPLVDFFFEKYPYSVESCPTEFIHYKAA